MVKAGGTAMVDVFISYKQEEREAVQIIASSLNDLKLSVWFDTKLRAGGSFDEEIAAALNDAKCVLVCWTPAAMQSEWVRGEATQGKESNRLAAAMLQPTTLIPPFNLVNAVNLTAWAGQPDDPAWLKLLERIGELTGRPGLSTYYEVMRAGASKEELHAWATENGADPLAATVWDRIKLIEGEGAAERIAREQAEARAAGERRRAQAERSRRLIRERGLRDPRLERLRFLGLVGSVAAIALISLGAIFYFADAQARERTLQNNSDSIPAVRAFLAKNNWHPIAAEARDKLSRLDALAWNSAHTAGTVDALSAYVRDANPPPQGAYVSQARAELQSAQMIAQAQQILQRLELYHGPIDGAKNEEVNAAIRLFRYRWNMEVSDEVDAALMQRLDAAVQRWIHPTLDELRASPEAAHVTEADFVRIAADYKLEAATFRAVAAVEGGVSGFGSDGRPIILFERRLFSRLTNHQYDQSHPNVSSTTPGGYPRSQADRWAQLAEAYELDPEAAFKATSFGVSQMLGMQYSAFGFETAGELVRYMSRSEANQYESILRYARANNMIDALQRHDWAAFARRYHGPAYASFGYDRKLSDAYARITAEMANEYRSVLPNGQPATPPTPAQPTP
jgi:hypothetical protein